VSNHPNRGIKHGGRNPSPQEVRAAREAAGLTQEAAAALLWSSKRNWQQWEYDGPDPAEARRMHPALFTLFLLLTKQMTVAQVLKERK
jgi:DNA-binding XRE family transcriptional regulator